MRFVLLLTLFFVSTVHAQKDKGNGIEKLGDKKDAKYSVSTKKAPPVDPALREYGIYAESAPTAEKGTPADTALPLQLKAGNCIAFVGNTLFDRGGQFSFFESMVYQGHPDLDLVMRNFSWSADEVDLQPRPEGFATVAQHLTRIQADVVFAAFGYNESFLGEEAIPQFRERLTAYLTEMKAALFNGETGPQIVLVSPIANEDIASVPGATMNNERLALYVQAMAEVAAEMKVGFADVYEATKTAFGDPETDLTINGAHMTEAGYEVYAKALYHAVFGTDAPEVNEALREIAIDKNRQYRRRYRPDNSFYYTGGRSKKYGYLDFLPAMRNFDLMTANREAAIHALAKAPDQSVAVDDSNLPKLDVVAESRGANEWLSPKDELAAFAIDPRFEVNAFATEEEFPEIACPISMRWDKKGRLWVSTSRTYPHVYPGDEPNDTIVILEDTDQDGKADKSTIFADGLNIPLSFVLTENGCYVSDQPDLLLLEDTDGDDVADKRTKVLTGFGTEDTHHSLHDFVWTPNGDLLFRESIFHNSQVETAYGPIRAHNSSWFRYTPRNQRLIAFGSYPNTNPWGVTFDQWGNHIASHPIFATAYHSLNPPYPKQQPKVGMGYSGVCGHEFVDFPNWPEELQGHMIKNRYKPTNRVEILDWMRRSDSYGETYKSDLIFSSNLSFIPVDLRFGPRGAMYVCDWYNPVKGHSQYSLRDPRRDRVSGRIWRIVPKGADLVEPPVFDGASVKELVHILASQPYRYRYWAKRELQYRDADEVVAALDEWLAGLDPEDERYGLNRLEAMWTYMRVGVYPADLITSLFDSENPDVRAAAARQIRFGADHFEDGGMALLERALKDEDFCVQMEGAIATSYFGTKEALEALLAYIDQRIDSGKSIKMLPGHLRFALWTALISGPVSKLWRGDEALLAQHPGLSQLVKWHSGGGEKKKGPKLSAEEVKFDAQENLSTVTITCIPERLLFDTTEFKVKAGQPVKLTLSNPDATQHNLVIVAPGSAEEMGMAGNEMAKDPSGLTKGFIPESDKVLFHTGLLAPEASETLRFMAPTEPGVYPYICTFPGHWFVMKGEMMVEE